MRDLNIDFMDLYKCVDKFTRDAYGSAEGVSEYIRHFKHSCEKSRVGKSADTGTLNPENAEFTIYFAVFCFADFFA